MSRLEFYSTSGSQAVVETLYRDLEHRIVASPPGLCPVDLAAAFLKLCHSVTYGHTHIASRISVRYRKNIQFIDPFFIALQLLGQ